MKRIGQVQIPQKAFIAVLAADRKKNLSATSTEVNSV